MYICNNLNFRIYATHDFLNLNITSIFCTEWIRKISKFNFYSYINQTTQITFSYFIPLGKIITNNKSDKYKRSHTHARTYTN